MPNEAIPASVWREDAQDLRDNCFFPNTDRLDRLVHACEKLAALAETGTQELLDAIEKKHVDNGRDEEPYCAVCGEYLPCKPLQLAFDVRTLLRGPTP